MQLKKLYWIRAWHERREVVIDRYVLVDREEQLDEVLRSYAEFADDTKVVLLAVQGKGAPRALGFFVDKSHSS
jgi:hypothetical protein